jgi:hypothetical protein
MLSADKNMFDVEAVECINADTNGNRRVIMNVAAMCVEEAARRNEKVITHEIVSAIAMEQGI